MTDIRALRKGLNLSKAELTQLTQITGIGTLRFAMAEGGLRSLKPGEEAVVRLAISYIMHCRSVGLAEKLSQGTLRDLVPITWEEYATRNGKPEEKSTKRMLVMTVRVDLLEDGGREYLPVEDPIPWDIEVNAKLGEVLAACPDFVESMLKAIRSVTTMERQGP